MIRLESNTMYLKTDYEYHLGSVEEEEFWSIYQAKTLEQVKQYQTESGYTNPKYFIIQRTSSWTIVNEK